MKQIVNPMFTFAAHRFGRRRMPLMIAGILICALFIHATAALAWWNEDWQYRQRITFDTTPAGADIPQNLGEIPVLLRLHSANFNFTGARDDGTDIRFVQGDDVTVLKHHIEKIDPLDEIAFIWVKVPRISGAARQDFIWMYYGNRDAVGGQDARGTYDVNQVAVFHFGELEGFPRDQTGYNNHAASFSGTQGLPGLIGNSLTLNGAGDRMAVAAAPSLDFSNGFTFSAWVRVMASQSDACLLSVGMGEGVLEVRVDGTKVYARARQGDKEAATEKSVDLTLQSWHHLAVTAASQGQMAVHLDGIRMTFANLPFKIPAGPAEVTIGADAAGKDCFAGEIDELRLANLVRSEGWLRAAYQGEGAESLLTAVEQEEIGGGGSGLPTFYLGTVVKNITLDGMVIIGILVLFSLASWLVIMGKGVTLWLTEKDNRSFLAPFHGNGNPFELPKDEESFQNSSLYRIYQAGFQELKSRAVKNGAGSGQAGETAGVALPDRLTPKEMEAFKSSLEKAYLNETKNLNSWLVVLTMAISGGPFLGLLGTVWGVMNTFAAMAEAGEANIMAIAPGVASALSTTVFGLLVAIPALFGYNYIHSKIRGIITDMTVFVDEFAIRAGELLGGKG